MSNDNVATPLQALTDAAYAIIKGPLANPKQMRSVNLNSAVATLCLCVAAYETAAMQLSEETDQMREALLDAATPLLRTIGPEEWAYITQGHDQECLATAGADGGMKHNCVHDEKTMPCLACPHLTSLKPDIGAAIAMPQPGPTATTNKPKYPGAAARALSALRSMKNWARTLPEEHHATVAAIAAANAVANAGYYTAAAIEVHPVRNINVADNGFQAELETQEEQLYQDLYQIMGGPAGKVAPPGNNYNTCLKFEWFQRELTEYACKNEEAWEDRMEGDMLNAPCNACPSRTKPFKPSVQELLAQALKRENSRR